MQDHPAQHQEALWRLSGIAPTDAEGFADMDTRHPFGRVDLDEVDSLRVRRSRVEVKVRVLTISCDTRVAATDLKECVSGVSDTVVRLYLDHCEVMFPGDGLKQVGRYFLK